MRRVLSNVVTYFVSVLAISTLVLSVPLWAQVRSSTNYKLQSDSVNIGGGFSSSTSYVQESTVGEIATGRSASASYGLQAGYQQMQEIYLSLAGGDNVIMDGDILGITGGTSNGSTTFTVITDGPAGYQLTIQAEDDPAMQRADGESIPNYGFSETALTFNVPAESARFGFTVDGVDITDYFISSAVCGSGSGDDKVDSCWSGVSQAPIPIAQSTGANHPVGATTTVQFRVGLTSGANIESGVYVATTTVTALPL